MNSTHDLGVDIFSPFPITFSFGINWKYLLFNFVFFKSMEIQHLCNMSKKNPYEKLNKTN
jgi:hypothetical protein